MILETLFVVTKSVPIRLTAEGRCVPRTLRHGGDFDFYNCCGGWCKEIDCFDYTPLIIGIICGAVVIVVLGGFFYFRRRQRRLEASRQPLVAAAEAPDYGCLCIWFRRQ